MNVLANCLSLQYSAISACFVTSRHALLAVHRLCRCPDKSNSTEIRFDSVCWIDLNWFFLSTESNYLQLYFEGTPRWWQFTPSSSWNL